MRGRHAYARVAGDATTLRRVFTFKFVTLRFSIEDNGDFELLRADVNLP